MNRAVITHALRTPIGKANGMLKHISPEKLAAEVLQTLIKQSGTPPESINDVILGNVVGPGGNMARLSLLTAGFPYTVPGVTIDRQCGSGLESMAYALHCIKGGAGDIYVTGGVESVSQAPWKMMRPQSIYQTEPPEFYVRAPFAPSDMGDPDMGPAAENVAQYYEISREEQDYFALHSHRKAVHSLNTGRFKNELVSLTSPNYEEIVRDECPRSGQLDRLFKRLPPLFSKDTNQGTVTAGNSCPMNDGAAAALMMSPSKAEQLKLEPLAEVVDATSVGVDPNYPGIGSVPAVRKLLQRNNLTMDDIDLIEFNEAFASQVLASLQLLEVPLEKVNLGGGALALGHPYGASGGVIMTRLVHELNLNPEKKYGIATMGIGGGMGSAILVERWDQK